MMCYTCAGLTPPFKEIHLPPCGMKDAEQFAESYRNRDTGELPVIIEDTSLSCGQYRLIAERGGSYTGQRLPVAISVGVSPVFWPVSDKILSFRIESPIVKTYRTGDGPFLP